MSELNTLTSCLKKHDYAYRQGLQQKNTPSYLSKGSYLHGLMAEWLTEISEGGTFDLGKLSKRVLLAMRDEGRNPITEVDKAQIDQQVSRFVREVDMSNVELLAIEQEFYVDLGFEEPDTLDLKGHPVLLHGFFDAVVRDKDTSDVWIVEHKTAGRRWHEGRFMFDFQAKLYAAAWEALTGERPVGILWNFFYKKQAEQRQQFVPESESAGFVEEVQNLLELRGTGLTPRQPMWGCNGCWFKDLCYTELSGGDSAILRSERFDVNEDKVERFEEES